MVNAKYRTVCAAEKEIEGLKILVSASCKHMYDTLHMSCIDVVHYYIYIYTYINSYVVCHFIVLPHCLRSMHFFFYYLIFLKTLLDNFVIIFSRVRFFFFFP